MFHECVCLGMGACVGACVGATVQIVKIFTN